MTAARHSRWVIWVTLLVGAMLGVMSLPDSLAYFRPAWVVLITMFWMLAQPEDCGLLFAWINGILLDVLYGTVLGQHAMAMVFVALAVAQFERRLRMSVWWQQSVIVLLIVSFYQMVILWIGSATGRLHPDFVYLLPAVTSAIVWPWLVAFLHVVRRRTSVI